MKKIERRDFLRTVALGALASSCSSPLKFLSDTSSGSKEEAEANRSPAARAVVKIRHEASSREAKAHLVTYAKGVELMRSQPKTVGGKPNGLNWEVQAEIHKSTCPHGTWNFFPWHREYLFRFESIIRELTGEAEFCLPYWDWTSNPNLPLAFKKAGSSLALDDKSRTTDISQQIKKVTGSEICEKIMKVTDFESFMGSADSSGEMEYGPHNGVHVVLGSLGSPMGNFKSPLDPIFWLHHCNVDRLWAEWQEKHKTWRDALQIRSNFSGWMGQSLKGFFSVDGKKLSSFRSAQDMIDTFSLGYAYPSTARRVAMADSETLGRSPASESGWHYQLRAFTRDDIDAKVEWNRSMTQANIAFPGFKGNTDRYLDGCTVDPDHYQNWVFRLRVLNFPKIERNTIMRLSFNVPGAQASKVFLANYCFFLPSADDDTGMGEHHAHHSSPYIPDFNFEFSKLLQELHAKGFTAYPDPTSFRLEFLSPTNLGPQPIGRYDFSGLKFKVSILEKVSD